MGTYDLENERALIVTCLKDASKRRMILSSLKSENFIGERFRVIFRAVQECARKGLQIDPDSVAVNSLGGDFGGVEFLQRLYDFPISENIEFHIRRLQMDFSRVLAKQELLPDLERLVTDRSVEQEECFRKASEILNLLKPIQAKEENPSQTWVNDFDRRCSGEVSFQSVGFESLDKNLIDGYAKKQVSVIAARTGNGKTSFVVDTTRRLLAKEKKPKICVLPLEIGKVRFLDKLVSSATMIPLLKLRKTPHELTLKERDYFKRTIVKMVGTDDRLTVIENPFFSLSKWTNETALERFEEILAAGSYDIVFLDLFQRILVDTRPSSLECALVKVQFLAKQYNVHLCLVHQIRRMDEERKGDRPEITDLKGSGGYEEVPDLILLLHRPKTYKPFRRKDEIEITPGKQRDWQANLTIVGEFFPEVSRIEGDKLMEKKEKPKEEDEEEVVENTFQHKEKVDES